MKRMTLALGLAALLIWANMPPAAARRSGSNEANKALVRRVFDEVFNQGKLATIDEVMAPTVVSHSSAAGEDQRGAEPFRQLATNLRTAYPDLHFTVEDQIAEGDKVVTRFSMHGTQTGEFRVGPGPVIAPTGKPVTMMGIVISRIEGGKIVESWPVVDQLGVMRQLGVFPSPPAPATPGTRGLIEK